MSEFPLKNPLPDFEALENVLKGEKKPERVHFAEPWVNDEIIKSITENLMGEKAISLNFLDFLSPEKTGKKGVVTVNSEEEKEYFRQYINFFYRMGYDFVPDSLGLVYYFTSGIFEPKYRISEDTAILSRGKRAWSEEGGKGVITSWEDFDKFPWEKIKLESEEYYEFLGRNLPEGMKLTVCASLYQQIMERILGYEGLFYLLHDEPDLVEAVFNKWGEIVYRYYESVISLECVGCILHGDDLGFKTGTMLKPETLRKLVFPWFKKYVFLAHKYGKMCWYHCCGNVLEVMEDLIEDVGFDAFHSFQDVIIPVGKFKKRYGKRMATLGGVDVDKLSRLNEKSLREYVRNILNKCMPAGRYALGSGNSITNFVPVKNYLIMLEEGLKW